NELPARGRPLGVDRATGTVEDVGTSVPWSLLELGDAHQGATFRACAAGLSVREGRHRTHLPIVAGRWCGRWDRRTGAAWSSPFRLAHLDVQQLDASIKP